MMRRLPLEIIQAARDCDSDAVNRIFKHFEGFIISQCLCTYEDEQGRVHSYIDEDLRYDAEIGLYAAIFKFQLREPPDDFTL